MSEKLLQRLKPNPALRYEQTQHHGSRQPSSLKPARWIVFDPITRRSFRIGWIEHWLLTRIDGKRSTSQILIQFRREHPQSNLADGQLLMLIEQFCNNELIYAEETANAKKASRIQSLASSIVVWQIRGVQPDRWLAWLAPHANFLFSREAVQFWIWIAVATLSAVLLQFQRLTQQSFAWDWLLRPSHGGMLLAVFLVTRALHELGHALACKRFGVRCPDIGLFLILGAPCVYCDVSECWTLPKRWQRAAIAAAGMYVELVVATVAAWFWLATIDGPMNTLALQTMLVCSISTLLINANPLMRFDGYYILADWLDESNLRSKADALALGCVQWVLLGQAATASATIPRTRRRLLIVFSIAGWIYRALLSVTIATILIAIYANWNLAWVGRLLAATVLLSWWGVPMMKLLLNLWRQAPTMDKRIRLAGVAAAVVVAAVFVPVPKRRFAEGWIEPSETRGVYARAHARLATCYVRDGQQVTDDHSLFELKSFPVSLQFLESKKNFAQSELRYDAREAWLTTHDGEDDLSMYETACREAERRLRDARSSLKDLRIKPPMKGIFCAAASPPIADPLGNQPPIDNSSWCSPEQIGRAVEPNTLLGTVCGPERIAVIPLDGPQLDDVASGTEVRIRVSQRQYDVVIATVKSVVQLDERSQEWRRQTASTDVGKTVSTRSATSRYAAIVDLPGELNAFPGSSVDAVFVARSGTVAGFCASWLKANLRLLAD